MPNSPRCILVLLEFTLIIMLKVFQVYIFQGAAFVKGLAVRKMLLKDPISIKSTSKHLKLFKKSGGYERAQKDFASTGLTDTRLHKQMDKVYKGYCRYLEHRYLIQGGEPMSRLRANNG